MKISALVELIEYSKLPTCVHVNYEIKEKDKDGKEKKRVKKYRYKFEDFASFLEKAQRSQFFERTTIDELVVQRSLLNDDEFVMIYCTKVQEEKKDE